jgi:hypothetical protein
VAATAAHSATSPPPTTAGRARRLMVSSLTVIQLYKAPSGYPAPRPDSWASQNGFPCLSNPIRALPQDSNHLFGAESVPLVAVISCTEWAGKRALSGRQRSWTVVYIPMYTTVHDLPWGVPEGAGRSAQAGVASCFLLLSVERRQAKRAEGRICRVIAGTVSATTTLRL